MFLLLNEVGDLAFLRMKICFDVLIFELPGNGLLVNLPKRRIRIRMMRCRVKLLVFELCFTRGVVF